MHSLVIFLGIIISVPVIASDLLGSIVPPYPDQMIEAQAGCVYGPSENFSCEHSIGIIYGVDRHPVRIIGKEKISKIGENTRWIVTDILNNLEIPENYLIEFSTCQYNETPDDSIVAVVSAIDEEWLDNVLWAFRLDLESGKFVKVSSSAVRCINIGWGEDTD